MKMLKHPFYSIVQYCADPERLEVLNVGVLLIDPKYQRVHLKFADKFDRIQRVFGGVNRVFLNNLLSNLEDRIRVELQHGTLDRFFESRSNVLRFTPVLPVLEGNLEVEIQKLYDDLVGQGSQGKRRLRVSTRVKQNLDRIGILPFLDRKPSPVHLDRYDIVIKPEYGFQNGKYNLIDIARFDQSADGLAEAGQRALEGRAVSELLGKKLNVIGDFENTSEDFFIAIREDLKRAEVDLYRLDDLSGLAKRVRPH